MKKVSFLKGLIMNRSLRVRMILMYAIFTFIVIGLMTYFTYSYIISSLKETEHIILLDSIQYVEEKINARVADINQEFLEVFTDVRFQELYLESHQQNDVLSNQILLENQYREYFSDIQLRNGDIIDSILLVRNGKFVYSNDYNTMPILKQFNQSVYESKANENKNIVQYLSKSEESSTAPILRSFYYTPGKDSTAGYLEPGYLSTKDEDYSTLLFFMKKKYFKNIILDETVKRQATIYIISDEGEPILSQGNAIELSEESFKDLQKRTLEQENGYFESYVERKTVSVYYRELDYSNWKIMFIYDQDVIYQKAAHIRSIALAICGGALILVIIIASFISGTVVKPIRKLGESMNAAVDNELNIEFIPMYNDEIADLNRNFNAMMYKISVLIDDIKLAEEQKRKEELKVLQEQIKPHFLYNTLDTIYWLAMMDNNNKVANMISDLAGFFRLSLNNGDEIATVEHELNHIIKYMDIQQVRLNNGFSYNIDVCEDVLAMNLPRLILQPIVENAIVHGFKGITYKGEILINIECEDDILKISIKDNGLGISQDNIEILNDYQEKDDTHIGYAVWNIIERIRLYAGDGYGLSYSENEPNGTCTLITFPAGYMNNEGGVRDENDGC